MRRAVLLGICLLHCGGQTGQPDTTGEKPVVVDGAVESDPESLPLPPVSWIDVSACGIRFRAPPEIREEPVTPIDSCVTRHVTDACVYIIDYGWYSGDLAGYSEMRDYSEISVVVDGRKARLVTAYDDIDEPSYWAAIHVPMVDPDTMDKLTIAAECSRAEGVTEAKALFGSISF